MTPDAPSYRALNQPWRWTVRDHLANNKRYRDIPVTHVPTNIEMLMANRETRRKRLEAADYEARLRATEAMESDG